MSKGIDARVARGNFGSETRSNCKMAVLSVATEVSNCTLSIGPVHCGTQLCQLKGLVTISTCTVRCTLARGQSGIMKCGFHNWGAHSWRI